MLLYHDQKTRSWLDSPAYRRVIRSLALKRRDVVAFEVAFLDGFTICELPEGTTGVLGMKKDEDYNSDFTALALGWVKSGAGSSALYTFELDLRTAEIDGFFQAEEPSAMMMLEMRLEDAEGKPYRSPTIHVTIENAVITGEEGTPSVLPEMKATEAEAREGTSNLKWMTPLATAAAIEELAGRNKSLDYTQATPSTLWTIPHNLGFKPTVSVFSPGGLIVMGDVQHLSENTLTINFVVPVSGSARLN